MAVITRHESLTELDHSLSTSKQTIRQQISKNDRHKAIRRQRKASLYNPKAGGEEKKQKAFRARNTSNESNIYTVIITPVGLCNNPFV